MNPSIIPIPAGIRGAHHRVGASRLQHPRAGVRISAQSRDYPAVVAVAGMHWTLEKCFEAARGDQPRCGAGRTGTGMPPYRCWRMPI
jgi:hypothetical protein